MMPIKYILLKEVVEPEVIDLERIGGRLEYHNIMISVDNMFISDCGERWKCELSKKETFDDEKVNCNIVEFAPTLRQSIIGALKKLIEKNH